MCQNFAWSSDIDLWPFKSTIALPVGLRALETFKKIELSTIFSGREEQARDRQTEGM